MFIHEKMSCEYLKIYNYKRSFKRNFIIFDFLILSRIALKFSPTSVVQHSIISKEFIVLMYIHVMIKAASAYNTL